MSVETRKNQPKFLHIFLKFSSTSRYTMLTSSYYHFLLAVGAFNNCKSDVVKLRASEKITRRGGNGKKWGGGGCLIYCKTLKLLSLSFSNCHSHRGFDRKMYFTEFEWSGMIWGTELNPGNKHSYSRVVSVQCYVVLAQDLDDHVLPPTELKF